MGLNALQPGCVLEVGASFVLGSGALGHGLSSSHPQELPNSKCCSSMHRGILSRKTEDNNCPTQATVCPSSLASFFSLVFVFL